VPNKPDLAVLFDLDGVIVDSREHHLRASERWAAEHEIAHGPAYFHDMFGRRNDAIIGGLIPDVTPQHLAELAAHKESLFRESARANLSPLPGVLALLNLLDEHSIPCAIVTSTPRANLTMILETLALDGRFGALVAEEDAANGKPDPEGFLVAAQQLDLAAERCVVIEDAPAGIKAAKTGGMRAIGVTTTHGPPALVAAGADLVVNSLADGAVLAFLRF
jgi:HAD superfamily hydrolase (TIGR01509 family)